MRSKQFFVILFSFIFLLCASNIEAKSRQEKRPRKRAVVIKPDTPRPEALKPLREDRVLQNQIAVKLGIPVVLDNWTLEQLKLPQDQRSDPNLVGVKYRLVPPLKSKYATVSSGSY